MVSEAEHKKGDAPQELTIIDLDPQHATTTNGSSQNGVGYNKISRRLSNVSNAIQQKILEIREEGNFTLGMFWVPGLD